MNLFQKFLWISQLMTVLSFTSVEGEEIENEIDQRIKDEIISSALLEGYNGEKCDCDVVQPTVSHGQLDKINGPSRQIFGMNRYLEMVKMWIEDWVYKMNLRN